MSSSAAGSEGVTGTIPRGTPFDPAGKELSVLSYNLLAPLYVRTLDTRTGAVQPWAAFEWSEPAEEVLVWSARQPKLLAELQRATADVICLQEVQFERVPVDAADEVTATHGAKTKTEAPEFQLPRWLADGLPGYASVIPPSLGGIAKRNARVLKAEIPIGNAILYRKDRLEVAGNNAAAAKLQDTTRIGVGLAGINTLSVLPPTVFVSVHLDARDEEKRVKQLEGAVAQGKKMGVRDVVIAGDFNTDVVAGTCLIEMLENAPAPTELELAVQCKNALRLGDGTSTDAMVLCDDPPPPTPEGSNAAAKGNAANGHEEAETLPTAEQLEQWNALRQVAKAAVCDGLRTTALQHVTTGPTRAAYDHGMTVGPCVSWRIDHMLYTSHSLTLAGAWQALEADPEAAAAGLPCASAPSDHLPIAAKFAVGETDTLEPAAAAAVEAELAGLEAAQTNALQTLKSAQQMESAALEAEEAQLAPAATAGEAAAAAEQDAASEEQPQKKQKKKNKSKKKKRGPPSEKAMTLLRGHREVIRELKASHVAQRVAWLDSKRGKDREYLVWNLLPENWIEAGKMVKRLPSSA